MTSSLLTPEQVKAKVTANKKIRSQKDVLRYLPCLTAHLIAESLGYFTPEGAASPKCNGR